MFQYGMCALEAMFLKIRRLNPMGEAVSWWQGVHVFFCFFLLLQPFECPAVGRASPSLVWPLWAALCGQPESLEGQEEEQGVL